MRYLKTSLMQCCSCELSIEKNRCGRNVYSLRKSLHEIVADMHIYGGFPGKERDAIVFLDMVVRFSFCDKFFLGSGASCSPR
jgi:hypothetical protein